VSDKIKLDTKALDELRDLQRETGSDLLQRLLQSYLNTTPRLLEDIRKGMASQNTNAVYESAHSLKSSSAYVGATALSELAQQLEAIGLTGSLQGAEAVVQELETAYQQVDALLRAEMERG